MNPVMNKTIIRSLFIIAIYATASLVAFGCAKNTGPNLDEAPSYFGTTAVEAKIKFKAHILLSKAAGHPTEKSLKNEVKSALKYTLGKMHKDGSIYAAFETELLNVESASSEYYKVSYSLSGKGVFKKGIKEYLFYVPTLPNRLYELSKNKCHDIKHQVDSGNFWYDWDPSLKNCPFVEKIHYLKIAVPLTEVTATKESYPEYDRLLINKEMNITLFASPDDHKNKIWNPLDKTLKDAGSDSYNQTRKYILKVGFKSKILSETEVVKLYNLKSKHKIPFVEEMTQVTPKGTIRIRLVFLETMFMNDDSQAFHYALKHALKNESVVMYDGHSGIGRNLNLPRIEKHHGFKFVMNENYQIIYLGSCIPYSYYVDAFFQKKMTETDVNGTKNLDMLAYGKEAHFGNVENLRIIQALNLYMRSDLKYSYQKIIGPTPVDFFGVIGDEDNNPNNSLKSK